MHSRLSWFPAVLAVLLAGCFPYSCNRTESRLLLPADSLARAWSEELPVDTLEVLMVPELPEMRYPRTLAFAPDGSLWISDTGDHQLVRIDHAGEVAVTELDTLEYPYLVGFRDGHPAVLSPAAGRIVGLSGTLDVPMPSDLPERVLQYAAVSDTSIWVKVAAEGFEGHLSRLAEDGSTLQRFALEAPFWRWAGPLRLQDGHPVSLSGYRPQVYTFEAGLDSLALFGFDSPMLPRSRAFVLGAANQPPLLTPSAAYLGDALFVINVRPGWLRVEVYDADGRLMQILVEPDPAFGKEFYPTDIAVKAGEDGTAEIAVTITEPDPGVRRYRARLR
ncbi:MAG: hypothetical protein JJ896_04915 [Rhodothermales bacterium]|nr:hypothetical protein [Rhodothermales bacterium]MBO6778974.1 hypothetical protein [Rhodothermales bacterium]